MSSVAIIPILTLGKHREVSHSIAKVLAPHGFSVNGVLSSVPFRTSDLALALRVLEPRPQALLVGGVYNKEEAEQAQEVFNVYMREVGVSSGAFVRVEPDFVMKEGPENVGKWILKQLIAKFRS